MKIATTLLAGAILITPAFAQAQSPDAGKSSRSENVRVPRGSTAANRAATDTDRVIDDEQKRIDHMMAICTGC